MAFNFTCPKCGSVLQAEEAWEGKETTCPHCGGPVRILRSTEVAGAEAGKERRKLKKIFFWWWFTLALVIPTGILCGALIGWLLHSLPVEAIVLISVIAGALAGSVMSLISSTMWYILLYRYWRLIPPERAATTPGKAVGFLFIPVFNLYWMFVSLVGLGKALDREGVSRGLGGTAMAYCVIFLVVCCLVGLLWTAEILLGDVPLLIQVLIPVVNLLQLPTLVLYIVVTVLFQKAAFRLPARREYGI